tara:strand:- start:2657 stop:3001 length:345 start_codon:yes stop_codon:yes gene_type:complete
MNKTIFEKIIDKELPANIIFEDDQCIVIEDISPKAPIHLLVIPKKPIKMLSASNEKDQALLGHLMLTVKKVSEQLDIKDNFNVVINNGEKAGQTVFHLHLHILSGKNFSDFLPA